MTDLERTQADSLSGCTFLPGSWDKRFVRDMAAIARDRPTQSITEKQAAWLDELGHRYRKQLNRCLAKEPCALCQNERAGKKKMPLG